MNWPRRNVLLGVLAACVAVAVVVLFALGRAGTPTDTSPDAGFARDMGAHHAQAVEMAFIVLDASDAEDVHTLADDIIVTQTAQRGMFMGWLQQWGLDQGSTRPVMAWMSGHGHGMAAGGAMSAGTMPGLATQEELTRLKAAKGAQAEVLFLQLMIRHHEGGVRMAKGVLNLSDREEVRTMAQHIVDSQTSEISLMKEMLKKRGAQPYPAI